MNKEIDEVTGPRKSQTLGKVTRAEVNGIFLNNDTLFIVLALSSVLSSALSSVLGEGIVGTHGCRSRSRAGHGGGVGDVSTGSIVCGIVS